jgi:hypothetical protein
MAVDARNAGLELAEHDVVGPVPVALLDHLGAGGAAVEPACEHDAELTLLDAPLAGIGALLGLADSEPSLWATKLTL